MILNQGFDIILNPEYPWAGVPQLRDGAWHEVRVIVSDGTVQVFYDEQLVLNSSAVLNRYKGGVLWFYVASVAAQVYDKISSMIGSCR